MPEEKTITQHDGENKQLKGENEKLRKENEKGEMPNENEKFLKNNIVKDANIKELIEEPKEKKSPNWIDKTFSY